MNTNFWWAEGRFQRNGFCLNTEAGFSEAAHICLRELSPTKPRGFSLFLDTRLPGLVNHLTDWKNCNCRSYLIGFSRIMRQASCLKREMSNQTASRKTRTRWERIFELCEPKITKCSRGIFCSLEWFSIEWLCQYANVCICRCRSTRLVYGGVVLCSREGVRKQKDPSFSYYCYLHSSSGARHGVLVLVCTIPSKSTKFISVAFRVHGHTVNIGMSGENQPKSKSPNGRIV